MRVIHRNCSHYPKRTQNEFSYKALFVTAVTFFIVSGAVVSNHFESVRKVEASYTETLISATASATLKPTVTPTIAPSEEEKIVGYIKTIFGSEWKTACAVAKAESGLRKKANNTSTIETSIGIFQINIKSKTTLVHWSRIPGETIEDKKTWLENPYNNTLMAYWIYTKSGWYPWTTFTKEAYEAKLDECK